MRVWALLPIILNMSLTAGIIIILVLLARVLLKKAPKIFSYALWAVVLFRLVCPVSFSSEFSLLGIFRAPAATNGRIAYIPADIVPVYPLTDQSDDGKSKIINADLPQGGENATADRPEWPMAAATALWLGGIAAMLIYSAVSLLLVHRKLIGAVRLRENIYLADHISTPFVIGVIRPKIYLPSSLPEKEQGYIILHEQTHIRRFDHISKMIAFLALAVHWFNPLVWAAFVNCVKDMEMSCDERVLKEMGGAIKGAYSTSLLSLATGRRLINGSPLAFGEGNLKGRIRNVMNFKKPRFWVPIVTAAVVIVTAVCLLANPPKALEVTKAPEAPEAPKTSVVETSGPIFPLAPAYTSDKCLYMTPLSSSYSEDDTGLHYLFGSDGVFTIINEETKEVQESISPIDWTGKEVDPKEWNSLFDFDDPVDISSYSARRQYEAADKYRIYQMDDEVWLAIINGGRVWSLYRLRETTKPDSGSGLAVTELAPASPAISPEQEVGADMAELDYASRDIVIFHGYFGLFVYDLNARKIVRSLDLKPIECTATQGDNYCDVTVSADGNVVQLHPMSSKDMYVYTVSDNTLRKTAFEKMENRFADFIDITDVVDYQKAGSYSHNAVEFDTGDYGYLHTTDWTLGTLTYIRGGDMLYRLFDFGESSSASAAEPWEPISRAFAKAFFEKNTEVMKSYLLNPDKGYFEYDLGNGLNDNETMKLKFNSDDIRSDSVSVQYEFRFDGDDSYSYLSLSMKKVNDTWKIESYGLEK